MGLSRCALEAKGPALWEWRVLDSFSPIAGRVHTPILFPGRPPLLRKGARRPIFLLLFAGPKHALSRCSGGIGTGIRYRSNGCGGKFWLASWQDRRLQRRHDPLLSRGPEQLQTMELSNPRWDSTSKHHTQMCTLPNVSHAAGDRANVRIYVVLFRVSLLQQAESAKTRRAFRYCMPFLLFERNEHV